MNVCALVVVCMLIPTVAAGEQAVSVPPAPSASQPASQESKWSADLSIDFNRSDGAPWWQVMPSASYYMTDRWSVEFGAPFYFVNGDFSDDGRSHAGIGDLYGGVSVDLSGDVWTVYSTVWGSIATGSESKGLGAGQGIWEWTNHIGREAGRVTPYADIGLSNALNYSSRAGRNLANGAPGASPSASGNLFSGEAGIELSLSESVSLSASGYVTRPIGAQAVVRRRPPRGPGGRFGGPGGGSVMTLADDRRDEGLSTTLWGSLHAGVDVSILFWRSTTFDYNTLSVGVVLNLANLLGR